jgi:hypothetical protein
MSSEEERSEEGLERRARDSRMRLFETIDALERRGTRLVDTLRQLREVAALAVDAVAVLGAVMSLLSLLKTPNRHEISSPRRTANGTLGRVMLFAVFAGVAYLARPRAASGTYKRRNQHSGLGFAAP